MAARSKMRVHRGASRGRRLRDTTTTTTDAAAAAALANASRWAAAQLHQQRAAERWLDGVLAGPSTAIRRRIVARLTRRWTRDSAAGFVEAVMPDITFEAAELQAGWQALERTAGFQNVIYAITHSTAPVVDAETVWGGAVDPYRDEFYDYSYEVLSAHLDPGTLDHLDPDERNDAVMDAVALIQSLDTAPALAPSSPLALLVACDPDPGDEPIPDDAAAGIVRPCRLSVEALIAAPHGPTAAGAMPAAA